MLLLQNLLGATMLSVRGPLPSIGAFAPCSRIITVQRQRRLLAFGYRYPRFFARDSDEALVGASHPIGSLSSLSRPSAPLIATADSDSDPLFSPQQQTPPSSRLQQEQEHGPQQQPTQLQPTRQQPQPQPQPQPQQRRRQIWLDLRGTALLPDEAIEYLDQMFASSTTGGCDSDIRGSDSLASTSSVRTCIDRILVAEDVFFKILQHQQAPGAEPWHERPDLVYVITESGDLISSDHAMQQSIPMGRTLPSPTDRENLHDEDFVQGSSSSQSPWIDPLVVLDTIASGQWLLLDQSIANEQFLSQQLGTLMEAAMTLSSSQLAGGLWLTTPSTSSLLQSSASAAAAISSASVRGGLAIPCTTPSILWHVAACWAMHAWTTFQSGTCTTIPSATSTTSRSNYGNMTESASGIWIPMTASVNESIISTSAGCHVALVLPFDIQLWQAARDDILLLQQDESGL